MNGHVGAQLDCSVVVTGIGPVFLLDDFVVMCTNMFVYVYNYTEGIRSQASRHIRAYLSGSVTMEEIGVAFELHVVEVVAK